MQKSKEAVFNKSSIVAFRGCAGNHDAPHKLPANVVGECIWSYKSDITCRQCERLAPEHYWKFVGSWKQARRLNPYKRF